MQARPYLISLLALTLLGFTGVAAFNYVVDPYRFFDSADRVGINEYRNKFFFGQYVAKPYALRRLSPDAVILGVSRAGSSMATDHPGWADNQVYNYAMAGSTAYLIWRNYQHARASGDLKKVVLMLDFYMFNTYKEQRPQVGHVQGYEERLSATAEFKRNYSYPIRLFKDTLTSLISFEMLYESWSTALAQEPIAAGDQYKATLTRSGFWINDPTPHRSQRQVFRQIERQYMTITWFPRPLKKFAMKREDGSNNLVYLQRIIADAHSAGIDLRLGFMPFHARLAEAMRAVGIWDDFEQWKRDVVALVETEALSAGQPSFPLWDFTGYNSVNTERVPSKQNHSARMRWHLDSSHVSRATGDLIQSAMLGTNSHTEEDFGLRVTGENIEDYIQSSRLRREHYAQHFSADIEEVLQRARQTADWRREPQPAD